MPQTLIKADGLKLHVDHTFTGGEIPSKQIVVGGVHGNVMALTPAVPASPNVHLCTCQATDLRFFYDNGEPLNVLEHTQHLPVRMKVELRGPHGQLLTRVINPRQLAEAFVAEQEPPTEEPDEVEIVENVIEAPHRPVARQRGGTRVKPQPPAKGGAKVVLDAGALLGTSKRPVAATAPDIKGLAD